MATTTPCFDARAKEFYPEQGILDLKYEIDDYRRRCFDMTQLLYEKHAECVGLTHATRTLALDSVAISRQRNEATRIANSLEKCLRNASDALEVAQAEATFAVNGEAAALRRADVERSEAVLALDAEATALRRVDAERSEAVLALDAEATALRRVEATLVLERREEDDAHRSHAIEDDAVVGQLDEARRALAKAIQRADVIESEATLERARVSRRLIDQCSQRWKMRLIEQEGIARELRTDLEVAQATIANLNAARAASAGECRYEAMQEHISSLQEVNRRLVRATKTSRDIRQMGYVNVLNKKDICSQKALSMLLTYVLTAKVPDTCLSPREFVFLANHVIEKSGLNSASKLIKSGIDKEFKKMVANMRQMVGAHVQVIFHKQRNLLATQPVAVIAKGDGVFKLSMRCDRSNIFESWLPLDSLDVVKKLRTRIDNISCQTLLATLNERSCLYIDPDNEDLILNTTLLPILEDATALATTQAFKQKKPVRLSISGKVLQFEFTHLGLGLHVPWHEDTRVCRDGVDLPIGYRPLLASDVLRYRAGEVDSRDIVHLATHLALCKVARHLK